MLAILIASFTSSIVLSPYAAPFQVARFAANREIRVKSSSADCACVCVTKRSEIKRISFVESSQSVAAQTHRLFDTARFFVSRNSPRAVFLCQSSQLISWGCPAQAAGPRLGPRC